MRSVSRQSSHRPLTIFAQDPSTPLLTQISVPAEQLAPGPCGYRIRVVDYDASSGTLYEPMEQLLAGHYVDRFEGQQPDDLITNPQFHQQNVYAIAMRVLGCFESALGRHVSWQFNTHQLKIAPHAFREANAFYSRDDEALLFGYFPKKNRARKKDPESLKHIFTCLSHDIVAHETGHALLDGVRENFLLPSMPDQEAFHEGFSDLVAILSVASVPDLVERLLNPNDDSKLKRTKTRVEIARTLTNERTEGYFTIQQQRMDSTDITALGMQYGSAYVLFALSEEMGEELTGHRGAALRSSLDIVPRRTALVEAEFEEPHRRGELLVAAVLRAVLSIANERCYRVGIDPHRKTEEAPREVRVSRRQLAECLAESASDLLTMCIRALDYIVPVHVTFSDFLTGMLTADVQLVPDDRRYQYRTHVSEAFLAYGIGSASNEADGVRTQAREAGRLRLEHTDHRAMMFDRDEMFRFIWENRDLLCISDAFYTEVTSVSPCVRVGPEGTLLYETVVEYVQSARLQGRELIRRGFRRPPGMPGDTRVDLYGGGTLVFDVRGGLKYHIQSQVDDPESQNLRVKYNFGRGVYDMKHRASFSSLHESRSQGTSSDSSRERWR